METTNEIANRKRLLRAIAIVSILAAVLLISALLGLQMGGGALISREICQMQGDQALAADDINAALGHYDRAILFDQSNAQALMNRAGVYEQTGQIERAIADYQRVATLSSAPAALSQQAADRLKVLNAANP